MYNESFSFSSPTERVKEKLKSSICCFRTTPSVGAAVEPSEEMKGRTPRSPCVIKDKCKYLIARIGKGGRKHYSSSSDFSYDPMSYSLNFEDESSRADELPFINFTSRLPSTPERTSAVKSLQATPVSVRREVLAYS
ncbi:uncharacterized protein LOC110411283 [Herrania umbratica]|uniref:Uncharacterized protein LOC110411283 n=1 Tax=Herrania umbratica TaxID=108875 RepID=A0A6J0ZQW5_9ROSI|nr:uncharacterized protein LOC110411283 [Herrania umbratica]